MRILACSDLHCDMVATKRIVEEARGADVVVVAGDIATKGQGGLSVLDILRQLTCPMIIVAGNHDNLTELRRFCHDWSDAHVLHGEGVVIRGIPFFGLGGEVPRVVTEPWNFGISEGQARAQLQRCPAGAVMVTHTPPLGHCDRQANGKNEGSTAILNHIERTRPRLHLCGHIHASFGATSMLGDCPIHNLGPIAQLFSI